MTSDPEPSVSSQPSAPGPGTSPDERILLVRLSHLGDVVHALPVYHALRRAYPRAALAWAVQSEFAPLLEHLPGLTAVVPFDRQGGFGAWPRLRHRLRSFRATWAVDCQGNWKSALATRLAGARRRSGPARGDWREPSARVLVPDRPTAPATGSHAVERSLHLARHLVPAAWPTPWAAREQGAFDLGHPEVLLAAQAERARAQLGSAGSGPPVVLALGRPDDPRSWPAGHFAELARSLARAGRQVLLLSGPAEAGPGAELQRLLASWSRPTGAPAPGHWVGQRGLSDLAAWLRGAAELGATFVGSDSGPLHLAWAMGLDVLCLAGPQDPHRTGPWPPADRPGSPHRSLSAPVQLACRPCLKRRCEHAAGPVCLTELTPAQVAAVLLADPDRPPGA